MASTDATVTPVPIRLISNSPTFLHFDSMGFAGARARSDACRACYAAEAEAHGCAFLDANDVFAIPDPAKEGGDGIHLSPANAKALGAAVAAKIESMMA